MGREVLGEGAICIHTTASLHSPAKTNTTCKAILLQLKRERERKGMVMIWMCELEENQRDVQSFFTSAVVGRRVYILLGTIILKVYFFFNYKSIPCMFTVSFQKIHTNFFHLKLQSFGRHQFGRGVRQWGSRVVPTAYISQTSPAKACQPEATGGTPSVVQWLTIPPAHSRHTGSISGPGRPHRPQSNQARVPQLLTAPSRAHQLQLLNPVCPRQGKPPSPLQLEEPASGN